MSRFFRRSCTGVCGDCVMLRDRVIQVSGVYQACIMYQEVNGEIMKLRECLMRRKSGLRCRIEPDSAMKCIQRKERLKGTSARSK